MVVRAYNAQGVANTLWAYATMGREPGERAMGLLEGRVEEVVREYNAQGVEITLWAYATMGREPGERVMGLLEGHAVFLKSQFSRDHRIGLVQLHQCMLSFSLQHSSDESQRANLLQLRNAFGSACRDEFFKLRVSPSETQKVVCRALCRMGLIVVEEARCPRSGYSIDMLAREPCPSAGAHGELPAKAAAEWAVEFDGPQHFLKSGSPTGSTLLKRRHLKMLGYSVVSVPYWEWEKVRGDEASQEVYLWSKIRASPPHRLSSTTASSS